MKRFLICLSILSIILLWFSVHSYAKPIINSEYVKVKYELLERYEKLGKLFYVMAVDDGVLLAYNATVNPDDIYRGEAVTLFVVYFNPENLSDQVKVKAFRLPLYELEQLAFKPGHLREEGIVYFLGNNRSKLIRVNINTNEVKTLFRANIKEPSIRFTGMLWFIGDKFFATARFMRPNYMLTDEYVVNISPESYKDYRDWNKAEQLLNLSQLFERIPPKLHGYKIASDKSIVMTNLKEGTSRELWWYYNGKLEKVDEGLIGTVDLCFAGYRVLYSKRVGRTYILRVVDKRSGKVWEHKGLRPWVYPFWSYDCKRAIISYFNLERERGIYYFLTEDNDFTPQKLLEGVKPSTFKLSLTGNFWAYVGDDGIIIGRYPQ